MTGALCVQEGTTNRQLSSEENQPEYQSHTKCSIQVLTLVSQHRTALLLVSLVAITCKFTLRIASGPTAGRTSQGIEGSVPERETGTLTESYGSLEALDEMEDETMCWMENPLGSSICTVEEGGMVCIPVDSLKQTVCTSPTRR